MAFYCYRPDANRYAGIRFSMVDVDRIVDTHYTDQPLREQWTVPVAHGIEDNPVTEGDFPSLSDFWRIPVMSQRAWDAFSPLIGNCCEALPIVHPTGKPYFIIHVMDTIDCLDLKNSEVLRSSVTGRVSQIKRYAFKSDLLRGRHIFKLPLDSGSELIVDDSFRRVVESHALKGLRFRELPMVGAAESQIHSSMHTEAAPPENHIEKSDRPLSGEEQAAVDDHIAHAMKALSLKSGSATPDMIQQAIYEQINLLRATRASYDQGDLESAALCLGCLWGQSVCDRLGWHWANITIGDETGIGIVSSNRSHVVFPLANMMELIKNFNHEQTSLLVYNMLKAGSFDGDEGSYTVVS